ncbi:P-loop containing nucleoside triphosphate hydrolase protein [Blastocladiella britannica]|nr:P-loop containing nucleoside triphosphate hydrolase protein [Blastocladiella britannica]
MIAASISELGLGKLAAEQAAAPAPVVVSKKKIDIVAEYAKRPAHLNLVICGHVDAGKSTLTGHLLLQTGAVDKKTVDTYARDAARSGKGSFALAWVLDQGAEERARGVTIDVGVHHFTTPSGSRVYTVLDAPGHRDFIPNMISGAAQADVAVLVVDATEGEFEAGLHGGGQAREHLLLVKSLGIPRLVIAVNKMDVVAWRQDRFAVIVAELEIFLRSIGYDPETQVAFVPTSGLAGTNLTTRVSETESAWAARGKSLIEVLDTLPIPTRPVAKPLRIPVTDYAKGGSASGSVTVWGRIEAGGVQVGDVVRVMPLGEDATVRAVDIDGQDDQQRWAATGDHVALSLAGLDPQQLSAGLVICDRARPVLVTNRVEAKLVVFDLKVPITLGFPMILHQGSVNEPASITQLIAVLDKRDGKITKKNPRVLTKGMTALVEISTERPVCLEPFTESREFGRFMLRKGGETLAAGIVSKVVSLYQPAAMRAESRSSSAWSLNE